MILGYCHDDVSVSESLHNRPCSRLADGGCLNLLGVLVLCQLAALKPFVAGIVGSITVTRRVTHPLGAQKYSVNQQVRKYPTALVKTHHRSGESHPEGYSFGSFGAMMNWQAPSAFGNWELTTSGTSSPIWRTRFTPLGRPRLIDVARSASNLDWTSAGSNTTSSLDSSH